MEEEEVVLQLLQVVVDREVVEGLVRGVVATGEMRVVVEEGIKEMEARGAVEVVDTGVVEVEDIEVVVEDKGVVVEVAQ